MTLMKVDKVPDSTFEMIGGCDKQKMKNKVIELPIKHPEVFILKIIIICKVLPHFSSICTSICDNIDEERVL